MDFSDALYRVRANKRVRRENWHKEQFLFLEPVKDTTVPADHPMGRVLPVGSPLGHMPYLAIRSEDGTIAPWIPTNADLLAEDWTMSRGEIDDVE